jgi:sodium-dependent phosphate cotransporter
VLFLVTPGILLGLVYMCTADSVVAQVFGWIIAAIVVVGFAGMMFWYQKKGGREMWHGFLEKKRLEREAHQEHRPSDPINDAV